MDTVRFENPPLSFNASILFIEKQDEVCFKIFADGIPIGFIITRNDEWNCHIERNSTDPDKQFLIDAAKSLNNFSR